MFAIFITCKISYGKMHEQMHFFREFDHCLLNMHHMQLKPNWKIFFPRKISYYRNDTRMKYEFHLEPYFWENSVFNATSGLRVTCALRFGSNDIIIVV